MIPTATPGPDRHIPTDHTAPRFGAGRAFSGRRPQATERFIMNVALTPITEDNLGEVYDLKVADGQDEFVASNPVVAGAGVRRVRHRMAAGGHRRRRDRRLPHARDRPRREERPTVLAVAADDRRRASAQGVRAGRPGAGSRRGPVPRRHRDLHELGGRRRRPRARSTWASGSSPPERSTTTRRWPG
jgi:hypothetical protein